MIEEYSKEKNELKEMQGLSGPFCMSEKILQKIWHKGEFRRDDLKTLLKRPLEILKQGTWNKGVGPDFLDAEILIDGKLFRGDVELHFYIDDWKQHKHAENLAYKNVILHVVLFPCYNSSAEYLNAQGELMETLVLLPYLKSDFEEYFYSDLLSELEGRKSSADLLEKILGFSERERNLILRENAFRRWEQKLKFFKKRLETTDYPTLCHQIILEILGLKKNREAMAKLALKYSPETMLLMDETSLFSALPKESWNLSGIRPANQPKHRLSQYLRVLKENPLWSEKIFNILKDLPVTDALPLGMNTKDFRLFGKMSQLKKTIQNEIFKDIISGTRFETLMIDGIFPLMAANTGKDFSAWWFHWYLGDAPGQFIELLKESSIVSNRQIFCNGYFQGILNFAFAQMIQRPKEKENGLYDL